MVNCCCRDGNGRMGFTEFLEAAHMTVSTLIIDKLYPDQQYTVFRLHNRIEPSAALFWALGIELEHILKQLTQPAGPASVQYGRGQLGSI